MSTEIYSQQGGLSVSGSFDKACTGHYVLKDFGKQLILNALSQTIQIKQGADIDVVKTLSNGFNIMRFGQSIVSVTIQDTVGFVYCEQPDKQLSIQDFYNKYSLGLTSAKNGLILNHYAQGTKGKCAVYYLFLSGMTKKTYAGRDGDILTTYTLVFIGSRETSLNNNVSTGGTNAKRLV